MRELADAAAIRRFMRALGRAARRPARVYFTGGATAVLAGWRPSTIDIDLKIVPEDDALLRAIPELKDSLHVNVELASPDDFIPIPAGWEGRHPPGVRGNRAVLLPLPGDRCRRFPNRRRRRSRGRGVIGKRAR